MRELQHALEAARSGHPDEMLRATERVRELAAAAAHLEAMADVDASAVHVADDGDEEEDELGPEPTPEFLAELRATPPPLNEDKIREVFDFYCNFGRTMAQDYQDTLDSFMFMKFARECPGLLTRSLTRTDIDLIFTKAKAKGERRLTFSHFLDGLAAIAEKKFPAFEPPDGLRLLISRHLNPLFELVQREMRKTGESEFPLSGVFKKLYDPRSYTGVYAQRFRSGDGRINGESDNRVGRSYNGHTNQGTDEVIHDISVLMRPELRSGTMMRSRDKGRGGSPPPKRSTSRPMSARLMSQTASSAARRVELEAASPARGHFY